MGLTVHHIEKDNSGVSNIIQNAMAEFSARRAEQARLAQNESQYGRTLTEQKRLNDAAIGEHGANTAKTEAETLAARVQVFTAGIKAKVAEYAKNGEHVMAGQFAATSMQKLDEMLGKVDPNTPEGKIATAFKQGVAEDLFAWFHDGPDTNTDVTNRNKASALADITSRVANAHGVASPTSGASASDMATTMKLGGAEMTAPVFADVQQQGEGSKQHSRYVDVVGELAPNANTLAQTSSNERIQRAHDAVTMGGNSAVMGPAASGNGASGDEFLKTLPPDLADVVRKVANYEVDPVQAASLRKGSKDAESERLQLIRMATQYDPKYDMTLFPGRKQAKLDFSPGGKSANNIKSLNTILSHISELSDAAKGLDNVSGVPLLNTAINAGKNYVTSHSGGGSVAKFDNAAVASDSELAAALKGGGATDQEIKAWQGGLNSSMSGPQQEAAIKTRLHLVAGRLRNIVDQPGRPQDVPVLTPESRDIFKRFGIDPETIEPTQSGNGGGGTSGATTGGVITDPNHVLSLFTPRQ